MLRKEKKKKRGKGQSANDVKELCNRYFWRNGESEVISARPVLLLITVAQLPLDVPLLSAFKPPYLLSVCIPE